MSETREMPRYQCHKKVWGLKIDSIEFGKHGVALIVPAEEGYAPFETKGDYTGRYMGDIVDHGYYVLYEGGYESWSPSKAFEGGYTRI